jgi:GTP-binding protein
MSKPIVAIVGRPNVGKSTLFNKLIGERRSIVEDTPGVTRDRIYAEAEWCEKKFILIDTGGIEPKSEDTILKQMRNQAEVAIATADCIVFMCDIRAGLLADDKDIAIMLKKSGKPVILCVNKVDRIGELPYEFYEFYELGFEREPIAISSLHGTGSGDLLDAILDECDFGDGADENEGVINVAVIGKPNAGKSSIINRMCGEERVIVSDIAGTTRDAVDTMVVNQYGKYNFIDTAGIRRHSKVEDRIEKFSVIRANMAVERADVCLLMIDANDGVTEQDEKIAGIAHDAGKASIIVVNKWDSIEKENSTVNNFNTKIKTALSYMTYAPIVYVSAKTGQRVANIYPMIQDVYREASRRIQTGMLNDLLNDAMTRVQPPSDKGKRLKIYYMTQVSVNPPTFVIFCNSEELFHFSYRRYIENCLRDAFGFEGTPIKIIIRQKGEDATSD